MSKGFNQFPGEMPDDDCPGGSCGSTNPWEYEPGVNEAEDNPWDDDPEACPYCGIYFEDCRCADQ